MRIPGRVALAVAVALGLAAALVEGAGSLRVPGGAAAARGARTEPTTARAAPDAAAATRAQRDPAPRAEAAAPSAPAGAAADTEDDAGADAGRAGRPAQGFARVQLDPIVHDPSSVTVTVTGFDPGAPRELRLWRLGARRAVVIASTRSARDGRLAFPPVPAPRDGFRVVATPAGVSPESGLAVAGELAARAPRAPDAALLGPAGAGWRVRVLPAEPEGAIVLATPRAHVFGRFALPARPDAAGHAFDLLVELSPDSDAFLIGHELVDGRRSDWRRVPLPEPDPQPIDPSQDQE